jgi:hypothetical protein
MVACLRPAAAALAAKAVRQASNVASPDVLNEKVWFAPWLGAGEAGLAGGFAGGLFPAEGLEAGGFAEAWGVLAQPATSREVAATPASSRTQTSERQGRKEPRDEVRS